MPCPVPAFPLALKIARSPLASRERLLLAPSRWAEEHAETGSLSRTRASERLSFPPGLPCPGISQKMNKLLALNWDARFPFVAYSFNRCSWAHFLYFQTKK